MPNEGQWIITQYLFSVPYVRWCMHQCETISHNVENNDKMVTESGASYLA